MISIENLQNIRNSIANKTNIEHFDCDFTYDSKISQVYITLFQDKINPIRWGSRKKTLLEALNSIVKNLNSHQSINKFDITNSEKCQIMFEIVTQEYPCNIRNLTGLNIHSPNRFEPGVNGLKWVYKGVVRYFMPTDGYTKSIMSVNQLLNYLSKQCGVSKQTDKISQRVKLMRELNITYSFIKSKAYINYKDTVLELNRGIPKGNDDLSKELIFERCINSANWLIQNQYNDGSFLYFYDALKDSIIDDMHPKMINPLYNNILRHSGGTITLLRAYELSKNALYLQASKKSIDFFITTLKYREINGDFACFPFFNKKSKLGGAGVGLVAMMMYRKFSGDKSFDKYINGLVIHILSQIIDDGEMQGYYIHPLYNNGNPIVNPDLQTRAELFSFYYPGEALLGLALYILHFENIKEDLKNEILEKSKKALDFLVDIRPVRYSHLFTALPADAWLMQAIEEWVKIESFNKQSYIDFVYNDTKQLFNQMYTSSNTTDLTQDYMGGFFYNYGDHVYHDASRCEGIVSAYYLAKYLGDEDFANQIMSNMKLSAKGIMLTYFDEKSVYPHKNQSKALHSFRFKLTRQWIRVDSVQHAVCFLSRLYNVYF